MEETVSLPYLEALKGKFVKVFKGGPDSREGKLLEVKDDYIVLQTKDKQLVYYASQYLKIVIGKAKKSDVGVFPVEEARVFPNTFLEVLETLVSSTIKVNGGGPESKIGQVLDAKEEFLVLSTEKDGLVVFPYTNVKNVTILESQSNDDFKPAATFTDAITFNDVLSLLIHNWVSINTGGLEKVGGVLVEVADEHVIVVQNEEIFYVTTEQIKVLSLAMHADEDENSSNEGSLLENSYSYKGSSEISNSTKSSSYESGTTESSSDESSSNESSADEGNTTESSSYESSSNESSSDESSSNESSSDEGNTTESSSDESSSNESSSDESSSNESSSDEGSTTESLIEGFGTIEFSTEENNLNESPAEGEESVALEGEENVRPEGRSRRVNIFKQMWLENMIKASKGIYKEED
ncbi:hypothetical protein CN689_25350 [Peribacillus butanolivorans]|uniref:Spore coat protein n=1 Tax=Peribacillus butanolivorans TaxID=421767 RepID=A0AAX0RZ30_9BACI|nr:hypothetical protein [Peribacillus butanolivorans]PEJ25975.1 hypothetical protein CN689_25350 [Peribacillus butanolivorans]